MNYQEKTIYFPNMTVRVYIPELSQEDRTKRIKAIHNAAADLLKKEK